MGYPRYKREPAFAGLLTLLRSKNAQLPAALQLKSFNRWLLEWDDVAQADQPIMFLFQGPQEVDETPQAFGIPKRTWHFALFIYFRTDGSHNQSNYPDALINTWLDWLEESMRPVPGCLQNLAFAGNGAIPDSAPLIYHCFIQGTESFYDGYTDQQGLIVIPGRMLTGV